MSTRGYVGFIHRGKITGWFNHWDSYPSSLGRVVITFFQQHTQAELRTLFLERIEWVKEGTENDILLQKNSGGLLAVDWSKPVRAVRDNIFYKCPVQCEYTYLFNLDSNKKEILLFKGFGDKPSKGYEDWSEKKRWEKDPAKKKERIYNNYCGKIRESTKDPLNMVQYLLNHEARYVLRHPMKNLPLLIGKFEDDSLANELLEKRIRQEAFHGIPLLQ